LTKHVAQITAPAPGRHSIPHSHNSCGAHQGKLRPLQRLPRPDPLRRERPSRQGQSLSRLGNRPVRTAQRHSGWQATKVKAASLVSNVSIRDRYRQAPHPRGGLATRRGSPTSPCLAWAESWRESTSSAREGPYGSAQPGLAASLRLTTSAHLDCGMCGSPIASGRSRHAWIRRPCWRSRVGPGAEARSGARRGTEPAVPACHEASQGSRLSPRPQTSSM